MSRSDVGIFLTDIHRVSFVFLIVDEGVENRSGGHHRWMRASQRIAHAQTEVFLMQTVLPAFAFLLIICITSGGKYIDRTVSAVSNFINVKLSHSWVGGGDGSSEPPSEVPRNMIGKEATNTMKTNGSSRPSKQSKCPVKQRTVLVPTILYNECTSSDDRGSHRSKTRSATVANEEFSVNVHSSQPSTVNNETRKGEGRGGGEESSERIGMCGADSVGHAVALWS